MMRPLFYSCFMVDALHLQNTASEGEKLAVQTVGRAHKDKEKDEEQDKEKSKDKDMD